MRHGHHRSHVPLPVQKHTVHSRPEPGVAKGLFNATVAAAEALGASTISHSPAQEG
jgi:hypothetical protein